MAADSVEREILIEASAEVVWSVITEPEHISGWFSDEADLEGRAGADGTLTWKPGGRGGEKELDLIVPIRVVDAEPFRRFCFRWSHPEGAHGKARYVAEHQHGWEKHLGEMLDYVASKPREATR